MYYCIVNPKAKSGKGGNIWRRLEKKFKEYNLEYKAVLTKAPGHATELAESLTSAQRDISEYPIKIIVLGGDGTLNEVINGISDFDRTLVGYIPIGSGNDFARDLEYPSNKDEIIESVIKGEVVRTLDLGRIIFNSAQKPPTVPKNEKISKVRMFDVSAGMGFDAAVCEAAVHTGTKKFLNKLGLGKLTYGSIAIKQLMGAQKVPCTIEFDDGSSIKLDHFLFIAAMIHHYEGGGFKFAPNADLTDGFFDLCIVGDMPKAKMLFALPFSYFGKHYGFKGIYYKKAKRITIKTQAPIWVHTDGEVSVKSDNLTMECLQQKLRLMN